MGAFDIFYKKEKMIRKTIQIDSNLYTRLNYLSKNVYDTSTNMLINASIGELIKTENITSYKKEKQDILEKHTLLIRESFVIALDELKDKYDMPIYKLVNMAIKIALTEVN